MVSSMSIPGYSYASSTALAFFHVDCCIKLRLRTSHHILFPFSPRCLIMFTIIGASSWLSIRIFSLRQVFFPCFALRFSHFHGGGDVNLFFISSLHTNTMDVFGRYDQPFIRVSTCRAVYDPSTLELNCVRFPGNFGWKGKLVLPLRFSRLLPILDIFPRDTDVLADADARDVFCHTCDFRNPCGSLKEYDEHVGPVQSVCRRHFVHVIAKYSISPSSVLSCLQKRTNQSD